MIGSVWTVFTDGASKNNPGKSGAGVYIEKDGVPVAKIAAYLDHLTNNQAEYIAMIIGLRALKKMNIPAADKIIIKADSQLVVKQLRGEYAVKSPSIMNLFIKAKSLLISFNYQLNYIKREENSIADFLANEGIKKKLKTEFWSLDEVI